MNKIIVGIYDYIRTHKSVAILTCVAVSLLLVYKVVGIDYKEDISDFLPLSEKQQNALKVYQDISGADKLFVVFKNADGREADADRLVNAINTFVDEVEERDTAHIITDMMATVDFNQINEVSEFVYHNIPYFLGDADYERIDSLLSRADYVREQLKEGKQALLFPMSSMVEVNLARDPLGIFSATLKPLQNRISNVDYELYEDCIFTPDMERAIVMITSPYGSSETDKNPQFIQFLQDIARQTMAEEEGVDIQIIGGPVIAQGNSEQIKFDSIISVLISVVLILLLLFYSFRNLKNILLIVLSISWGMLFAVGALSFVNDNLSIIVIGIASVIIGIAVNYPLHLIAHVKHTTDVRSALKEIVMPLLIGNVTTVGAFLSLVPLQSIALRDLGLFSSFLLVGTILFTLTILPHLIYKGSIREHTGCSHFFDKLSNVTLENKTWLVWGIMGLTAVFGYYSLQTSFDSNLSNINYISEEQKSELERFEKMLTNASAEETLYLVNSGSDIDEVLDSTLVNHGFVQKLLEEGAIKDYISCSQFITSKKEQESRLEKWRIFVGKYADRLKEEIRTEGEKIGFTADAFEEFEEILTAEYEPQSLSHFQPLISTVFSNCLSIDNASGSYSVVDILKSEPQKLQENRSLLQDNTTAYCFDVKTMNSSIAESLSDNFNYIGFMCGCIVFFFLWFSFGRIELAILSFVPMAISWLWILGIMAIFGIQFNIVNVILATFIFGQGDDYTIFMTEGASYEYTYRKKMLASYKQSIILSALIMFIGIGSLIVAKHPALHSLAEVTIVGMFSVVLMAYMFPPLIFKYLVSRKGEYRLRPLSISNIWSKDREVLPTSKNITDYLPLLKDRYRYKGIDIEKVVKNNLKAYDNYSQWADCSGVRNVAVINGGYGEMAILLALINRDIKVENIEADEEKSTVAKYSGEFLKNFEARGIGIEELEIAQDTRYFIIEPTEEQTEQINKICKNACIGDNNVVILRR